MWERVVVSRRRDELLDDDEGRLRGVYPGEVSILFRALFFFGLNEKLLGALNDAHGREGNGGLTGGLSEILAGVGGPLFVIVDLAYVNDGTHAELDPHVAKPRLRDVGTSRQHVDVRGAAEVQLEDATVFEAAVFSAEAFDEHTECLVHVPCCIFRIGPLISEDCERDFVVGFCEAKTLDPGGDLSRSAVGTVPGLAGHGNDKDM